MPIGTSLGAFYEDGFHKAAAEWDPKYDENEITPNQLYQNKELNDVEMHELGGIEIANKQSQMPFPDNHNPDSDFNSRFGNLPPSGILNDLKKPSDTTPPLVRKISDIKADRSIGQGYDEDEGYSNFFNTPISGDDENKNYKDWTDKAGRDPSKDSYDYDLQGAYKAGVEPAENGHLPDTFKKPNHITFSDESQYNGAGYWHPETDELVEHAQGGHWDNEAKTFTPGKTNFDFHSPQEMMDYFKKNEPDYKLILPQSDNSNPLVHRVSDVYQINPMNATENGVLPLAGAPERIGDAALIIKGKTYTGQNHGEAFEKYMNENNDPNISYYKDGFITSTGRFVSREMAMDIAEKAKQFKDKGVVSENITGLMSEDLKPETRYSP